MNVAIAIPPNLTLNYPTGQPGSFFTLTAEGFPENSAATVSINGVVLTTTLPVTSTGGFVALLNTTGLSAGYYRLTVSVNPSATTNFTLDQSAPLRLPEGSGTTFVLDGLGLVPLKLFSVLASNPSVIAPTACRASVRRLILNSLPGRGK